MESIVLRLLPATLRTRFAGSEVARRIARGSAWSFLGSASSRLLTLAAMILLARLLGTVHFGQLALVQATIGVAGMMAGFGLGSTATRFLARDYASDKERAGRVLTLLNYFAAITLLSAMAVIIACAEPLARMFLNGEQLAGSLQVGALLMGVSGARGVQAGVFAGFERFEVNARLNLLEGASALLLGPGLAWFFGIEGALLGLALGAGLAWTAGKIELRRLLGALDICPTAKDCWKERSILSSYSLPSFLASFASAPVLWLGMTFLAREPNGFTQLALYNAAYQWHGPLIFLPMAVLSASLPALTQQWHGRDVSQFRRIYLYNLAILGAATLIPALLIAAASNQVMALYGADFRAGWPVLVLLAMAAPLHAVSKVSSTALLGMNRPWATFGLNFLWSVVLVAVAYTAIPRFGAMGLAIAFLVAYGVTMALAVALVLLWVRTMTRES